MKKSLVLACVLAMAVPALAQSAGAADKEVALASSLEEGVIAVASSVGKAVVAIRTERTAGPQRLNPDDEVFDRFFNDFFGEMPPQQFRQTGIGSGVIIDPAGFILTNEHVIDKADQITVTLPDGREFKGELRGEDMRTDLAVIKIKAKNLPYARLGDSADLKIGQWVVAIGNPFGFSLQNPEPTVTVGVVSALHRTLGRSLSQSRDYSDLIQTDAAINPGNSGGPLVNLRGEVVGINVAIYSTTGGSQGIGFAVPAIKAQRILTRLMEGQRISYGWLGVNVQDITGDLNKYFGVAPQGGALIVRVIPGGPAHKAGLKEGDVITAIAGRKTPMVRDLLDEVASLEVGQTIKIDAVREKKPFRVEAAITERPKENDRGGSFTARITPEQFTWRGLVVRNIATDVKRFPMEESQQGVVVVVAQPNSPAVAAGIDEGDVILGVNKGEVRSVDEFKKAVSAATGDVLLRTGRGYFVVKQRAD